MKKVSVMFWLDEVVHKQFHLNCIKKGTNKTDALREMIIKFNKKFTDEEGVKGKQS